MRRVKILMMLLVAVWLGLLAPVRSFAEGAPPQPDVFGKFAVSIDAKSGDVLYDKRANEQSYPASITKVLTALLLMEHTKPGDRLAFSQAALNEEKSNYQIEFQPGETIDRDTALMILMVLSANDVAYAIAEHVSGSVEAFAKLMNERAAQLGAKHSNFVRPNGLHDPNHVTTPYDMAMITREVVKYPEIMNAMITKRTTVTTSAQTVSIFNKASFFENPDCKAGKTGFTSQAHNTLVLINQRDGKEIVNVVMYSQRPDIYQDMNIISDYAFSQMEKQQVLDQASWAKELQVKDKPVEATLERGSELMLKAAEGKNVNVNIEPMQFEDAKLYEQGIHKGEVVGRAVLSKNGQVLDTVNVLARNDVAFEKPKPPVEPMKSSAMPVAIGIVGLLVLGGGLLVVRRTRKLRNRQYM